MEKLVCMKYDIEVDDLFKRLNNNTYFNDFKIKRNYSKLDLEIKKYQELIEKRKNYFQIIDDGRQRYSLDIFLDNYRKNWYKIWWDINKAKKIISQNKLNKCQYQYEVGELIGQVDKDVFSETDPNIVDREPIIIASYYPSNMDVVIDGNHRVTAAYKRGEKNINAYCMEPEYHMQAMVDDFFVDMYKIHHNLVVIINYMVGNTDKILYKEDGDSTSLYNIKNDEETLLKKIRNYIKIKLKI